MKKKSIHVKEYTRKKHGRAKFGGRVSSHNKSGRYLGFTNEHLRSFLKKKGFTEKQIDDMIREKSDEYGGLLTVNGALYAISKDHGFNETAKEIEEPKDTPPKKIKRQYYGAIVDPMTRTIDLIEGKYDYKPASESAGFSTCKWFTSIEDRDKFLEYAKSGKMGGKYKVDVPVDEIDTLYIPTAFTGRAKSGRAEFHDEQALQDAFIKAVGGVAKSEQIQRIWDSSYPTYSYSKGGELSRAEVFREKAKEEGFSNRVINMFLRL